MKGTAQRTENWIMCDTPGAVDMSVPIMAKTMTMLIGTETSQNKFHPLMALFFSTTCRSILIYFDQLQRNIGRIPVIFSFSAPTVAAADRSRRQLDHAC